MRNPTGVLESDGRTERGTSLSRTAEHAVRAAIHLARQGEGMRASAASVAEALGIPTNYLSKTLNAMARAGVLDSRRGPEGGFALAVPPAELTLDRVIRSVDPPIRTRECLLHSGACDPDNPCAIHHRWTAVEADLRQPLQATTVQDLLRSITSNPAQERDLGGLKS